MKIGKYLLLYIIFISSCTVVQDKEKNLKQTSVITSEDKIKFKMDQKQLFKGITIENVTVDTLSIFHESEGIKFSFDANFVKVAFDSLKKIGYTSCYIQLSCKTDNGVAFSTLSELKNTKRMHINKERIFSFPDTRNITYQFPYRSLEMQEGPHHVAIAIELFPVNFKKDTSSPLYSFVEKISPKSIASYSVEVKVSAPKLFKTVVEISAFKINTTLVNPQGFDFSLGGSGYPDLYWDLYCGEDFIYYSPQEKNATEYKRKFSTKPFYCSSEDVIKISFADLTMDLLIQKMILLKLGQEKFQNLPQVPRIRYPLAKLNMPLWRQKF